MSKTKINRIIICVRGGCTQEVCVDNPKNIDVLVFDVDNMRAEGMSGDQIDKEWKELIKGTQTVF